MKRKSPNDGKKGLIVIFGLSFLLLGLPAVFAQEAPPEESSWYGDKGTLEIGVNGSITLPTFFKYSGTGAPEDDDDNTTMYMLSPFVNYFVMNQIHVGGAIIYIRQVNDIPGEEYNLTMWFLLPRAGYTLRITPKFQLDFSANLGYAVMKMELEGTDIIDSSSLSYGISAMALFPLTESAVFGIGVTVVWYKIDFEGASYDATARSTQVPFQVSFYF